MLGLSCCCCLSCPSPIQVTDEADVVHPVTLLLLVSAPPPRPEVMATIVLPKDPPQAGVDLAMDANTDLAFPSNSFIGQGAFGQVSTVIRGNQTGYSCGGKRLCLWCHLCSMSVPACGQLSRNCVCVLSICPSAACDCALLQVHRALLRGRHPVAVKMLTDPDLRAADPDTLRSFREELMIMAKLDHPHILRCYGGNLEVVNPFIVTELCECSLDKVREEGEVSEMVYGNLVWLWTPGCCFRMILPGHDEVAATADPCCCCCCR